MNMVNKENKSLYCYLPCSLAVLIPNFARKIK